jgi:transcriptional regulator with XRE-family HTH domain
MSARQLAIRAGLESETHVGLIEHAKRKTPSGETIAKLARALGVSMEWLQTGEGTTPNREALRSLVRAEHSDSDHGGA